LKNPSQKRAGGVAQVQAPVPQKKKVSEARESQVQGQPGLHKTLSQTNKKNVHRKTTWHCHLPSDLSSAGEEGRPFLMREEDWAFWKSLLKPSKA
jgi:hypothetical protein